jgi:hypothetical protein
LVILPSSRAPVPPLSTLVHMNVFIILRVRDLDEIILESLGLAVHLRMHVDLVDLDLSVLNLYVNM